MSEQLIGRFDMEMKSPSCTPGASWWGVKISLDDDISKVFPFLNAELKDADYNHKEKVLLWDSDKGFRCAFRPNEIAIAPVEDREVAQQICDDAIDMLNDIWNRRNQIEPNVAGKAPPPSMIQLLKLLPGTNCKECGYPTCMAFAAGLIKRQAELSGCPHLSSEA
ncbi:MAG: hypothetical protein HQ553_09075 [Chloroflexi bacterium]|nr:hypothetical protein [Chloroflexota bacterium]